jgi:hypothetical protein
MASAGKRNNEVVQMQLSATTAPHSAGLPVAKRARVEPDNNQLMNVDQVRVA